MIRDRGAWLTNREAEVLAVLSAFPEEELVYERGEAYLGTTRISARLVFSLIRKMCVSEQSQSYPGGFERYRPNETGVRALANHWGLAVSTAIRRSKRGG